MTPCPENSKAIAKATRGNHPYLRVWQRPIAARDIKEDAVTDSDMYRTMVCCLNRTAIPSSPQGLLLLLFPLPSPLLVVALADVAPPPALLSTRPSAISCRCRDTAESGRRDARAIQTGGPWVSVLFRCGLRWPTSPRAKTMRTRTRSSSTQQPSIRFVLTPGGVGGEGFCRQAPQQAGVLLGTGV